MRVVVGCRAPATPTLATVLDLSPRGCLVESAEPRISQGSTILMRFPGACEIAGQVMWRQGSRLGVKFNSSLEEGVVATILGCDSAMLEAGNLRDNFGRDLPPLPRLAKAMIQTVETGPEQGFG